MALNSIQITGLTVQGGGVVAGAVEIPLNSAQFDDNAYLSMNKFGAKGWGTIDKGTPYAEQISFTGITLDSNNLPTLTGIKHVSPYSIGGTFIEATGLKYSHVGNCPFTFSDNPAFLSGMVADSASTFLSANNTWTGVNTFNQSPIVPTPTTTTQATNKDYVDTAISTVVAGGAQNASSTTTGITRLSLDPTSTPIALGVNDPRVSPVSLISLNAGMVQALVGDSGTPSVSNTYLTQDSTTIVSASSKVVKTNPLGKIDIGFLPTGVVNTANQILINNQAWSATPGTTTTVITYTIPAGTLTTDVELLVIFNAALSVSAPNTICSFSALCNIGSQNILTYTTSLTSGASTPAQANPSHESILYPYSAGNQLLKQISGNVGGTFGGITISSKTIDTTIDNILSLVVSTSLPSVPVFNNMTGTLTVILK